jgi:hypothetical protein
MVGEPHDPMTRPAVIYLSRRVNPPRFAHAFVASLARNPPGADFDVIWILKGYGPDETDPALALARDMLPGAIHETRVADELFPTNVLLDVIAACSYERILFFTSYSRILAPGWLRFYLDAFERAASCGIVGATSGYETIPGTEFPNPNIRTNAFMIERKLMLDMDPGPLRTKRDGNLFEAGPASLTRQIMNRGLAPVIVDRLGEIHPIERWPESRTFRSGNQERLLISDNRTHDYQVAGFRKRRKLAILNWGERAIVTRAPWLSRLATGWGWRFPARPDAGDKPA